MPSRFAGTVRSPEFPPDLEWVGGERMTLAGLRGKMVILDFWTYCCINCMHIAPLLHDLEQRFARDLVVIGVHSAKFTAEREQRNLEAAVARLGIEHPVVNDRDHVVWDAFAVRAWPTLMLIDPRGLVIGKHEGEFDPETMAEFVGSALAEFEEAELLSHEPVPRLPRPVPAQTPLRFPGKIEADPESNRLFIADTGHHRMVITDQSGKIRKMIGSGEAGFLDGDVDSASFRSPQGMALSPDGMTLMVADTGNHAVRAIDLASGEVSTVAGTGVQGYDREGGVVPDVALASPWDLVWRGDELWIAMAGSHQVWAYRPETNRIDPVAGTSAESIHDGPLLEATFAQPSGITTLDGVVYLADSESSAIRMLDPDADRVRRLVGRGLFEFGDMDARGDSVRLQHPLGVAAAAEGEGHAIYLADSYNNKIKRLERSTRAVTTIFGSGDADLIDGPADTASFWEPGGLCIVGTTVYIADTNNHAIRIGDLTTGEVRTLEIS
jgi:thiol-disulfide isomerase/thioredoxin